MPINVEWLFGLVRIGDGTYAYGDPYTSTLTLACNGPHVVIKGAVQIPGPDDRRAIGRQCYAVGLRTYEWERHGRRTIRGEILPDGRLTIERDNGFLSRT